MIPALLIAIAICIDSFAIGITYGIKNIRIPKLSIFVINLVTICSLAISIFLGHLFKQFISESAASILSCVILVSLGSFLMIEGYIRYLSEKKALADNEDNRIAKIKLSKLGIIIDIGIDFTKADIDVSGDIDIKEAIYLGSILSIDSLCAGFGSAVGGVNYLAFLSFVFVVNMISILYGLYLGNKVKNYRKDLKTSLLPGGILIFMGMLKWI